MTDQKLVAIHDVSFLVEQLSYLQLLDKVCSLVRFDYFSSQAWLLASSVDFFK